MKQVQVSPRWFGIKGSTAFVPVSMSIVLVACGGATDPTPLITGDYDLRVTTVLNFLGRERTVECNGTLSITSQEGASFSGSLSCGGQQAAIDGTVADDGTARAVTGAIAPAACPGGEEPSEWTGRADGFVVALSRTTFGFCGDVAETWDQMLTAQR